MRVCEVFASIQGESTRQGRPCVFVRTAGCNLRCRWCDTPYALNPDAGEEAAVEEVLARVRAFGLRLVEVTGGEPLLQEDSPELIRRLAAAGHEVLVETNGTQDLSPVAGAASLVVDVKTPSSGHAGSFLEANLGLLGPGDELKFVVADRGDFDYAMRFIERHRLAGRCELLLSPAWGMLEPARLAAWILAERAPVRLQVQLHKYIWPGAERGV